MIRPTLIRRLPASCTLAAVTGVTVLLAGCGASGSSEQSTAGTSGALTSVLSSTVAGAAKVDDSGVSVPDTLVRSSSLVDTAEGDYLISPVGGSGNPYGFLRRVVSKKDDGATTTFVTEAARFTDVVQNGSGHTAGSIPESADDAMNIVDKTVVDIEEDLGDVATELKNVKLEAHAKIIKSSISFHPSLDIDTKFAHGELSELSVVADGKFKASLEMNMGAAIKGDLGADALTALQKMKVKTWQKKVYSSPRWALPTQWIGGFPLEENAQIFVNAICSLKLSAFTGGALDAHAEAEFTSDLRAGESYDGATDTWSPIGSASFATKASLDLSNGATMQVTCQLAPSIAIYFYDIAGPELGVGPELDMKFTTNGIGAKEQTKWELDPGASAWLKGNVDFLGYKKTFGPYTIWSWTGTPLLSGTL